MKRLLINLGIAAVLSLSMISALASTGTTQKAKPKAEPKVVIGYISDSSCGLQHMAGMNVVHVREFAGQKVKITGRITGKTIRVTAIEAAT